MAHPMGEVKRGPLRVDFDRRLKLEFHGSQISSDAGLLSTAILRSMGVGGGRSVTANVRVYPVTDRPTACAAGAGLNHAAVVVEGKATGGVCLDYEHHGHECHEAALDAGVGSKRSALPTPIDLRIAVESSHRYSDGQNQWPSGVCR